MIFAPSYGAECGNAPIVVTRLRTPKRRGFYFPKLLDMERTNQQQTPQRPTLADFGATLADVVQNYGTVWNDNTFDKAETAENVITALGEIAEEISSVNFPGDGLRYLMGIVNEYAVSAKTELAKTFAKKALAEITNIVRVGILISNYRPELIQFSHAVTKHDLAIARYDTAEYELRDKHRGK